MRSDEELVPEAPQPVVAPTTPSSTPAETPQAEVPPVVAPTSPRAPRELPTRPVPTSPPVSSSASKGIPTWLLTLLVCFALIGVISGVIFGINYFRGRKQATSTGLDPAANVARTKLSNPLQKSVEIVGLRILEDPKKKPVVRFVVVNHSPTAIANLGGTVTLWASTSKSEEDSIGTFTFKLPALNGSAAKEITSPLATKLKFYELPDWQNATPEVQITSPPQ